MNYKQLNGITIREGFEAFHKENPHIYKAFEQQVINAVQKGRTKLSAKLIVNWIRWNQFLESSDDNWKINDAYQSMYAREFIKNHPEHSGIFEMRKLRAEEPGPYMIQEEDGQLRFL